MISAAYYQTIYLFLVAILTYTAIKAGDCDLEIDKVNYSNSKLNLSALLLCIFMVLFIGLRPVSAEYFCDMSNYAKFYYLAEGMPYKINLAAQNLIWDNLFFLWASKRMGLTPFFMLISFIYFGCSYLACVKFFEKQQYVAFLVFLGSFSTFSYATNGIKAGAAAAFFLLGLAYYKNTIVSVILIVISMGFHHSMIVPIAAYALAFVYRNPKVYFGVWVFCLLVAAAHISSFQNLFASLAADQGDKSAVGYLSTKAEAGWGGKAGFRIDFVIYSFMPILLGYIAMFKRQLELSNHYKFLLNVYMITNSVWMLCMYANYNNRIAYLSWLMYPVLLVYPFVYEEWGDDRSKMYAKVVGYNIGFTLFMFVIYYGLLG